MLRSWTRPVGPTAQPRRNPARENAFDIDLAPVTISIGVHEALPDSDDPLPDSLWTAVDVADRALYAAKTGGRNRVVLALPA